MGERTGSRVLRWVWSYVTFIVELKLYIARPKMSHTLTTMGRPLLEHHRCEQRR
ncbi:hypothetical protein LZ30DRAFT_197219 [Colletotrichum cereale]|nr:hypothetical protein LZ30DRAFT_197219 [Colletotrichum cereale]